MANHQTDAEVVILVNSNGPVDVPEKKPPVPPADVAGNRPSGGGELGIPKSVNARVVLLAVSVVTKLFTPVAPADAAGNQPSGGGGLGIPKSVIALVVLLAVPVVTKLSTPVAPSTSYRHGPLYIFYIAMGSLTFLLVVVSVSCYLATAGGMRACWGSAGFRILMWVVVSATVVTYTLGIYLQLGL